MFLIISDCDFSCSSGCSSTATRGNSVSFAIKVDSQSTRRIKKPVYRLAKTKETDQKPVNNYEDCTKTKSVSVEIQEGNCSSKAKHDISGKDNTVSRSKTAEKEPSKPLSTTGTIPQRTERTFKVSLDEKSSQRSPSKLKKQLMSPSLVSAKQKDQRYNVPKKKCRAKEPSGTEHDSISVKTREPSNTSSTSKDSSMQQKQEPVKEMCQKHQEKECKAKKRLYTDAQIPSTSTAKQSSTLATHTTSKSSSKVLKSVTSVVGTVTSVSSKAAQSSPQQQIHSFKIPKKVLPRPVDSTDGNKDVFSKNTNLKHDTKLSNSEVSVRYSTHENVQQPHSCLNVAPSFPLEGQDKGSSLSGQLPAVSNTDTEPWFDQVMKGLVI